MPTGRDGVADAARSRGSDAPRRHLSGAVLVVEDNATNQLLMSAMLAHLGLSADIVSSGPEALEALQARAYDIVLMDIGLPGMDGIEATRRIRAAGFDARRLPVVAVTAYAMSGDRERFLAAGLDDYVAKPVDRAAFAAMLGRWLGKRSAKPAPPESQGFDASVLDLLARSVAPGAMASIVATFDLEARERSAVALAAARRGDVAGVAREAHPLKSSAGSVGLAEVAELAREIEALARRGDAERLVELCERLQDSLAHGLEALAAWVAGRP